MLSLQDYLFCLVPSILGLLNYFASIDICVYVDVLNRDTHGMLIDVPTVSLSNRSLLCRIISI